jgi:hypothetical protein
MSSVQVQDFELIRPLVPHGCLYAVPVRQASALPAASFGFRLATDTLAVQLTVPPVGPVEDFHLRVSAPCRAHEEKAATAAKANVMVAQFEDSLKRKLASGGYLQDIDLEDIKVILYEEIEEIKQMLAEIQDKRTNANNEYRD